MLNSIPVNLIVGCILGFLAGLGVGGGSLLILWLTFVLNLDHTTARIINLLFFIPSALIASIFRWRQGSLKLREILPSVLWGCAAAVICSLIGRQADITLLKKLFGGLLILTGIRELFYRERKAR